ncbi:MAG: GDSL-type esterase/lipase family protein [Kiritimatiellia bacterium]
MKKLMVLTLLAVAHAAMAAVWNFDPGKSEECRARDGLPNVLAKLKAGEEVRIAYLGGSITEANPGWRAMTRDWFRAKFPQAEVVEINASISGTGSDYGACRLPGDVLVKKPDLLFVEFRVNGSAGFDYQSTEGIIRQTWAANPKTDICFVYTLCEWMLKSLAAGRQTSLGPAMETLCNHYGIPSIDFGPEITRRLAEGSLLFKPSKNALRPEANQHADAKRNYEGNTLVFSRDGCHPVKEGHEIYRDVVARAMERVIFPASAAPKPHECPPQFSKNAWLSAELVPSTEVLTGDVWKPVDLESDPVYRATYRRTHRMLRGGVWTDREGTSVTLKWTGNTIGFSDIPQSREDPMFLEVSIDGGKPFVVKRGRTQEPRIYSRFWYLPEQTWGEHTVTVTLKRLPAGQRWILGQFLVVGRLTR